MNFISVIGLVLGILAIVFPSQTIMFGRRWMFKKDSKPSKAITYIGRTTGIILIVLVLLGKFK